MKAHTYGKVTLKRMSPLQRKVALEVNNLERTAARLRRVVEKLGDVEADAAARRTEREQLAAFVATDMAWDNSRQCIAHGRHDYTADGFAVCQVGEELKAHASMVTTLEMAVAP